MRCRLLPLLGVLVLSGAFVAVARAAFGITVLPATTTGTPVTLNGVDQTSSFTATITVSGALSTGWNITAWAPVPVSGVNTLAALVVPSQPTAGVCSGGGCNQPTPIGITWPVTVGTTAGGATKIYNANTATGKGTNTITVTFNIPVRAGALAASYTTTLTITGSASGP